MICLFICADFEESFAQNFFKQTKYSSERNKTPDFKGYLESNGGVVFPFRQFIENQNSGYLQPVFGIGGAFEFGYMTKRRIGVSLVIQQEWLIDYEDNSDIWYFESCQIGPYYSYYISDKLDLEFRAAIGISDLFYSFQNTDNYFDGAMWRTDVKLKFYFARKWGWSNQIGYTQSKVGQIGGANKINYQTISFFTGIIFRFK